VLLLITYLTTTIDTASAPLWYIGTLDLDGGGGVEEAEDEGGGGESEG